MGIHGLARLLQEECPGAIKEHEFENYTGRKIAIDASMAMYQFLVAVRSSGPGGNGAAAMLMNEAGEVTSHIQGMFNRTIRMMAGGIKPVYVFDGKPPQLKGGELAKRLAKRAKAENDLAAAKAAEEVDDINKYSSRLVKVTRQHNEDCKELLRLMGVPVIDAPCEAEAQCAELARKNKVFATATEDMDALTFRTPKLVRKMTFAQTKGKEKQLIMEIDFAAMLAGLDITYEMFVDLCILCGCDYCSTIKGIGPKTALKLIKQYRSIENVVKNLDKDKFKVPDDWLPQRISKKSLEEPETAAAAEADDEAVDAEIQAEVEAAAEAEKAEKAEAQKEEAGASATASASAGVSTSPALDQAESKEDTDLVDTDDEDQVSSSMKKESKAGAKSEFTDTPVVPAEEEGNDEDYVTLPPLYAQARQLFLNCEVTAAEEIELKWEAPDEERLTAFLVERMGFSAERVASGIKKLKEAQVQKAQKRMDSFFTVMPSSVSVTPSGAKRKADEAKGGANKKGGAKSAFQKRK